VPGVQSVYCTTFVVLLFGIWCERECPSASRCRWPATRRAQYSDATTRQQRWPSLGRT